MQGPIVVALLVIILIHQHLQMRLIRSVADKLGVTGTSHMELLLGPKPAPVVIEPEPVAATVSGFAGTPDFMSHARQMDARREAHAASPAAKMEALMMNNDQAQRKLRRALVSGN